MTWICGECGTKWPEAVAACIRCLGADLESERTARREADENRFALWQGEHDQRNRAIAAEQKVAALIAAVEEHEKDPRGIADDRLYTRVRSISQGEADG